MQTSAITAALHAARRVAGVSMVYTREGVSSEPISAIVGRTAYQQEEGGGVTIRRQVRDYLVAACDLVLVGGDAPILPQTGDRIAEEIGSARFIYEVAPLGGESPWRYMDPAHTQLRIHTQHVATESL